MSGVNAVILAAGRSQAFAPFSYERPKGLFEVKGEVLIERQIQQLHDAGVFNICIAVGFMKEKFFYLQEKYGVNFVFCNDYSHYGNLVSLLRAREYLENCFVCCADHYFVHNPFIKPCRESSYRACVYKSGSFREVAVSETDGFLTNFKMGGSDQVCMVGEAFFTADFARRFLELADEEINDFGVKRMFWEEFWGRHSDELKLVPKYVQDGDYLEFEGLSDISEYDKNFFGGVDSHIMDNIVRVLNCDRSAIHDIEIMNKGLSNVLFLFSVGNERFVYRHPGGSARLFANRKSEAASMLCAAKLGLDDTCIYMDENQGWKISRFVEDTRDFDFCSDDDLTRMLRMVRRLHQSGMKTAFHFDVMKESDKLMRIACNGKGDLFDDFSDLRHKMLRLYYFVKSDGVPDVLCHNDVYPPNFLMTNSEDAYLIDWEFSAMGDPANDFGGLVSRENFDDVFAKRLLRIYFQREPTRPEQRHFFAHCALTGWYFFCWSLYKDSIGEDSGYFMLNAYNSARRYYDSTIKLYEKEL